MEPNLVPARWPRAPRVHSRGGWPQLASPTPAQLAALFSAALALLVYLRTLLPGVSVGDWAESQSIPARLGIPHPTGYPLFVLAGKLFSLLPVGSVAYRAGLLSALAAAGCVAIRAQQL